MQRKLTDEELQHVDDARVAIGNMCEWDETAKGHKFWFDVALQLCDMLDNKTTDGKPYVDPEPPIPDGYRRAVEGDERRPDCKIWCDSESKFVNRPCVGDLFDSGGFYIVPVDKTPTDTEAQSLPIVMVRDYDDRPWEKSRLVRVTDGSYTCLAASRRNFETWSQCRHLYPNETP